MCTINKYICVNFENYGLNIDTPRSVSLPRLSPNFPTILGHFDENA